MHLNPSFISNVRDIHGEGGETWLKDLPFQINHLSQKWDFGFLKPMPTLSYHFVGLIHLNSTGKTAILKISPEEGSLAREIKWLNLIHHGAPKVYHHDEKMTAFLMEHLNPGETLKSLVRRGEDDQATRIICKTILELQSEKSSGFEFQHLSELQGSLAILKGKFDEKLLYEAQSLFAALTTDRNQDVLLHGDLHHDNILSNGSDWKVIDPHGYVGDPVADVGVMIRNPFDFFPKERSLPATIERRLQILAEELPFDPQRIKAWAFCMTVLSAAWTVEGHGRPTDHEIAVAYAIQQTRI